ncbi:MAG: protein kinase [Myxococcales bacterium]|nr:protein kinase [Myxococcales bacterium]
MKRKFVGRTIPKKSSSKKAVAQDGVLDFSGSTGALIPLEAIAQGDGEGATVVLTAGVEGLLANEDAPKSVSTPEADEGATVVLSVDSLPELSLDDAPGPSESPDTDGHSPAQADDAEEMATQCLPRLEGFDFEDDAPSEKPAAEVTLDEPSGSPATPRQMFVPKKLVGPLKPLTLPPRASTGSASTETETMPGNVLKSTPVGRRATMDELPALQPAAASAKIASAPEVTLDLGERPRPPDQAQPQQAQVNEVAAPSAKAADVKPGAAATLDLAKLPPTGSSEKSEGSERPEKSKASNTGRTTANGKGGKSSKDEKKDAAKATKDKDGGDAKSAFAFAPGDMVNHYELIRLLGKGGMGSVFMARDNKLGRRVAIKFLHTKDQELARRFILEARTTARCGHENIVIIYEADEFKSMPYMVLEYLQGNTLTKLMDGSQPMPPARVAELMVPVVRALVRAHAEGIVHRDLKPDNVMITESGTVKVLDFGISKVLESDDKDASEEIDIPQKKEKAEGSYEQTMDLAAESSDLTRSGAIVGTLAYMSPEQWRAKGIDHRTDIWATGIMLFRMLSTKHPLHGKTGMELAITGDYKHQMPSLRDFAPTLPSDLIDIVDKCLKKRKEQRWNNAAELLEALETFLPGRTRKLKIDESPYTGLSAFQEADADRFFGRNSEISAAVNRVREQPLIGIVGASGSGKSSIVRAGVLPTLKRSGEAWESLVIRPGRSPLKALADALSAEASGATATQGGSKPLVDVKVSAKAAERIREEPGYAGSVLRARARRDNTNILLFIDQFEELYTQVADLDERLAFTASLTSIADDPSSPLRVVLSIRSDFLERVAEDQVFMSELSQGLIFLIAPNRNGLREAIVQPAEMAGFTFENDSIVNEMLDHLATTSGALPLLQFAASKLWECRDVRRKMLTVEGYQALGGIAGALATHADSVLRELTPSMLKLARAVFLRLVTPERTRAIVSLDEIRELSKDTDELKRLIDQLVRARLLVVQTSGGAATIEIVHESLVHTWPTLRRWLDETGEDAAFLEQLRNAAKQWHAKDHDKALLWRGDMVEDAERFSRRYRGELPKVQARFLAATFDLKKRAARNRKLAIGGAFIVLLGLLVAAGIVSISMIALRKDAQAQAEIAKQEEAKAQEARGAAELQKQRAEAALTDTKKAQEAAEASAAIAQQRLERIEEESKRRQAAEERTARAAKDLAQRNVALNAALRQAEEARTVARNAQWGAEKNAQLARSQEMLARQAEERALEAAQEVALMLRQEQERVQRLQDQLGSPVIDELK